MSLHTMKIILFLRLLTQDEIVKEDIYFARVLIHEFSKDFSNIYGEKAQTFNLHAHLHLCDQVERFGPLHKHDCFPFEGWFKNASTLHNGTFNLSKQVANNLNIKVKSHYENRYIVIEKKELREFVQKHSHYDWSTKSQLDSPIVKGLIKICLRLKTSMWPMMTAHKLILLKSFIFTKVLFFYWSKD